MFMTAIYVYLFHIENYWGLKNSRLDKPTVYSFKLSIRCDSPNF